MAGPTASAAPSASGGTRLRLRLVFGTDAMLGPGKADLLEAIGEAGSIAAAGRKMGMSYKRAWSLVTEMNRAFRVPVVEPARGGARGGGARLTEAGETVLAAYRGLEARLADVGAREIATLEDLLRDMSAGK